MKKHKLMMIAALLAVLAGCAVHVPHGNFAKTLPAYNAQMADDTAKQLASLYPPARTRLKLQQPATDPFGMILVNKLRGRGYAVMEIAPLSRRASADAAPGTDLRYVVDRLDGGYLVVIRVGDESISRSYQIANNRLATASYWARKE